jgi:hypothetical protein
LNSGSEEIIIPLVTFTFFGSAGQVVGKPRSGAAFHVVPPFFSVDSGQNGITFRDHSLSNLPVFPKIVYFMRKQSVQSLEETFAYDIS